MPFSREDLEGMVAEVDRKLRTAAVYGAMVADQVRGHILLVRTPINASDMDLIVEEAVKISRMAEESYARRKEES
jgi:hypothetical protein